MKDLYYELKSDGYYIYDRNDSFFKIHQYEPYIPNKSLSYEDNAKAQIKEFMVGDYVNEVINNGMAIEDVPSEYKEEVKAIIENTPVEPTTLTTEELENAYKEGVNSI